MLISVKEAQESLEHLHHDKIEINKAIEDIKPENNDSQANKVCLDIEFMCYTYCTLYNILLVNKLYIFSFILYYY